MATTGADAAVPSILSIEAAALSAWPALKVVHDGLWVWRWAGGYTKRANSLNFLDPTDDADVPARLDRAAALARANGIDFVVRTSPLAPAAVIAELDARGFETFEESVTLWRRLEPGPADAVDAGVVIAPVDDPAWIDAQAALAAYPPERKAALAAVLRAYAVPAFGLTLIDDGVPVASCLLAIGQGIACLNNVVTDPARRRRGFGARLMAAAMAKARAEGAVLAAHPVIASNTAARALYERTGYAERYRYSYHRPRP